MKVQQRSKKKLLAKLLLMRKRIRRRRYWVHPVNKLRSQIGDEVKLNLKYREFPEKFRKDTRFTPEQFDEILLMLEESLKKNSIRKPISPKVRLYVTLRYLAHGSSMQQISDSFCMGVSTVSCIISETTRLIWEIMSSTFMPKPSEEDWVKIADEFEIKWQYPNCIGSLDGKHVILQCPNKSGSAYFNYKKTFSLNLMAMCDSNYRFTMIDVGGFGRQNDSGVFRESPFGKKVMKGEMNFPEPRILANSSLAFPFVIVADDAFPLTENIMKPFPGSNLSDEQRIYNYRHSRARRTIENAFGIMSSRFRVFRSPIIAKVENADFIVKACCVLHNFLRTWDLLHGTDSFFGNTTLESENTQDHCVTPGNWRRRRSSALQPMGSMGSNNYTKKVKLLRQNMATYFKNGSIVPWQENYVKFASWKPVK